MLVLALGAVVGAVASWFIAMPAMPKVAEAERLIAEKTEEALRRAA